MVLTLYLARLKTKSEFRKLNIYGYDLMIIGNDCNFDRIVRDSYKIGFYKN